MKQNNKIAVIGLTGPAGSGKSTVADILAGMYPVKYIHCDEIAKKIMEPGGPSYKALLERFGDEILEEGCINEGPERKISREKLAKLMFKDEKTRLLINSITHPLVAKEVLKEIDEAEKNGKYKLALIEAALLIESGIYKLCDEVWLVLANEEDRVQRMKENRNYSDERIAGIIRGQLSPEEFLKYSNFVIDNSGNDVKMSGERIKKEVAIHLESILE
ncbi:MAG: dephospho-CoA kinase [Lachnospiraceae bacterium]|nr:dephospho-CoA kinase [Lachnospiraceae bacterium]